MSFETDYNKSEHLNDAYLFPALAEHFGGEILSVRKYESEVESWLDRRAGVDALLHAGNTIVGLAARVQYGDWATFTVRYNRSSGRMTEYAKTINAIKADSLRPGLTVQGYISGDSITVGLANTKSLYQHIEANLASWERRRAGADGNEFLVVPWDQLNNVDWFTKFTTGILNKGGSDGLHTRVA